MDDAGLRDPGFSSTYDEFLPYLIDRFERAVKRAPAFAPAYLNLGNAQLMADDVDAAIATFHEATRVDQDHARAWTRLGNACLQRGDEGDIERAIATLQTALHLQPGSARAQLDLNRALRRSGGLPADGELAFLSSIEHDQLGNTTSIKISSDGRFAYASSMDPGNVIVVTRDPETGHLSNLQVFTSGDDNLTGVVSVGLSDDGRLAVTASLRSSTVLLLRRDVDTGVLSELDVARDGVDGVSGLRGAIDAVFSPDSRYLYVIGYTALSWFRVTDQDTLEFMGTIGGDRSSFVAARGLCVSPDGEWLYVTSSRADTLVALSVEPETGNPTINQIIRNGDGVDGLDGAFSVTCTADGRFVYTNSGRFGGDNAVCTFERRDGRLVFIEFHRNGINGVMGLAGGNELVLSPDGLNLYCLGSTGDAIACFDRDPGTGRLSFRERLLAGNDGPLRGVAGIAVSPDGRHVYAAAEENNAISIFERR